MSWDNPDLCASCGSPKASGLHYTGCRIVRSPPPRFTGFVGVIASTPEGSGPLHEKYRIYNDALKAREKPANAAGVNDLTLGRCPYDDWKPERSVA